MWQKHNEKEQPMFFQFSSLHCSLSLCPLVASDSFSWLTGVEPDGLQLFLSIRLTVSRHFSSRHGCKKSSFEFVWPSPPDLSHQQGVYALRTGWFCFVFHTILCKLQCVKIPGDQQFVKSSNRTDFMHRAAASRLCT